MKDQFDVGASTSRGRDLTMKSDFRTKKITARWPDGPFRSFLKRFAAAGLLFFLIKGLLWLLVPIAIAVLVR